VAAARTGGDPSAVGNPTSPTTPTSPVAGTLGPFTGPFGTGTYSHVRLTVTDVELSNLGFEQWGQPGEVLPDDENARLLYVTIELLNEDPNDDIQFTDDRLKLLIGDRPVTATRVNRGKDFDPRIKASDTKSREYGFGVGQDVTLDQLQLRYESGTVPVTIPLSPTAGGRAPYPVRVTPPKPGTFIGSLDTDCNVKWTLTTRKASVEVDLPSTLKGSGGLVDHRSPAGTRWLILDAVLTTSTAKCLSPQGTFTENSVRLVADGRPLAPVVSPLTILSANSSTETLLGWQISIETKAVALRGIGPHGSTFTSEFTLPPLPLLPGE
jgi:hypothetical protein